MFTTGISHDTAAFCVDCQVDFGLLALRVKARLRVGQVFAGDDHLLFNNHRTSVAFKKTFGAKRHRASVGFCASAFSTFIDQTHLQRGCAAKNIFGLGGVLHPRQLHHDAIGALLGNDWLGHAKFIDAVV